jgi:hypothetical protein
MRRGSSSRHLRSSLQRSAFRCVHFALSVLAHHACMLRHLNVSATSTVRCTCAHCTLYCTPESLIELHGQCNGDRHSAWGFIAHPRDCSRRRPLTHCVGPRPSHRTTGKDPSADTFEQRTRRGAENLESALFESAGSAPVAVVMVAALLERPAMRELRLHECWHDAVIDLESLLSLQTPASPACN